MLWMEMNNDNKRMLRENGFRLWCSIGKNSKRSIITKFAKKFIDDASYSNLENAMTQNNAEEAFRAVHTLKGICLNLGFDTLYKASFELTEKLRDDILMEARRLMKR